MAPELFWISEKAQSFIPQSAPVTKTSISPVKGCGSLAADRNQAQIEGAARGMNPATVVMSVAGARSRAVRQTRRVFVDRKSHDVPG